jgi:hypothetical protein
MTSGLMLGAAKKTEQAFYTEVMSVRPAATPTIAGDNVILKIVPRID